MSVFSEGRPNSLIHRIRCLLAIVPPSILCEGKAGAALLQRRSRRCSGGASPLAVPGRRDLLYIRYGGRERMCCVISSSPLKGEEIF